MISQRLTRDVPIKSSLVAPTTTISAEALVGTLEHALTLLNRRWTPKVSFATLWRYGRGCPGHRPALRASLTEAQALSGRILLDDQGIQPDPGADLKFTIIRRTRPRNQRINMRSLWHRAARRISSEADHYRISRPGRP